MSLLATLSESMTWTQKQILGFIVVGLIILAVIVHAWRNGKKLTVIAAVCVLAFLARGIGAPQ